MKAELDSVEVTFFSETFDREITADCNYKFYAGRGATKTDPEEAPERDFYEIIDDETGGNIMTELSDSDIETISDKIDDITSEGGE